MFTINDIFSQLFPWLEGISWDLGTVLTSLVFLGFLVLGFDWIKEMLSLKISGYVSDRNHDYFMSKAGEHEQLSMTFNDGSVERRYHEKMKESYISDAVKSKRRK